ncbi:hypothetical protein BEL05_04930 [Shewanella colwelliana]|uniref:Uncharacterized protein n=1 Tax=Shewanella colwelliana TaxID=23 RepID=A0A1E5IQU4_SHECO|nr:hypothetical protein [Shewanella colwelliana]OEG72323.1 hypothetical protein BEL05_04930 [Shewanella colwelliana]
MKKANPTVVGKLACGACSAVMEVRERSNGKKLLYTYCPNCKIDQRSSDQVQAFWRNNMVAPNAEITTLPTSNNLPVANNQPEQDTGVELDEWSPESELLDKDSSQSDSGDSSSTGLFIGGAVFLVLLVLGINSASGASQ